MMTAHWVEWKEIPLRVPDDIAWCSHGKCATMTEHVRLAVAVGPVVEYDLQGD